VQTEFLLQQFETMMTQSPDIAKRNNPKYAMHVGEESGSIMGHSIELLRQFFVSVDPIDSVHHFIAMLRCRFRLEEKGIKIRLRGTRVQDLFLLPWGNLFSENIGVSQQHTLTHMSAYLLLLFRRRL
jgi:hypothetical protein